MPGPATSTRTLALMNQKGGVGKTTTTVNLAAALAALGRSTLVIDLDPQAHATIHLGVDPAALPARSETRARSIYDLLWDPSLDPDPAIHKVGDHLALLPAETDLAGLETELSDIDPAERTTRLRSILDRLSGPGGFEFVLIDCPPSLGVLTLNALAAAREVIIPMQAHFLAMQGVGKLCQTVQLVGRTVNPTLTITGVVLCMHDPASSHVKEVVGEVASFFEHARASDLPWKHARVLTPPIRRNIKLAECPSFGQHIFQYAPFCPGALDYKSLAEGLIAEWDGIVARSPKVVTRPVGKSPSAKSSPEAAA